MPTTYGGLYVVLGGYLGTQQLWLSYQNSWGLQLELSASTEGKAKARRAKVARRRGRRDIAKGTERESKLKRLLLGNPSLYKGYHMVNRHKRIFRPSDKDSGLLCPHEEDLLYPYSSKSPSLSLPVSAAENKSHSHWTSRQTDLDFRSSVIPSKLFHAAAVANP